jgi:hypothetical protein
MPDDECLCFGPLIATRGHGPDCPFYGVEVVTLPRTVDVLCSAHFDGYVCAKAAGHLSPHSYQRVIR